MHAEERHCPNCGKSVRPVAGKAGGAPDRCPTCASPFDSGALSRFAARLARFGLGATPLPLLGRDPNAHDDD